jgi:hypothetical protein
VYIVVKLDYISSFISQPIGFLIALNTYIARGSFCIYVMYLYNILAVIESLLRYIGSDPPNILDYWNTIDIYLDPLYCYEHARDQGTLGSATGYSHSRTPGTVSL